MEKKINKNGKKYPNKDNNSQKWEKIFPLKADEEQLNEKYLISIYLIHNLKLNFGISQMTNKLNPKKLLSGITLFRFLISEKLKNINLKAKF